MMSKERAFIEHHNQSLLWRLRLGLQTVLVPQTLFGNALVGETVFRVGGVSPGGIGAPNEAGGGEIGWVVQVTVSSVPAGRAWQFLEPREIEDVMVLAGDKLHVAVARLSCGKVSAGFGHRIAEGELAAIDRRH